MKSVDHYVSPPVGIFKPSCKEGYPSVAKNGWGGGGRITMEDYHHHHHHAQCPQRHLQDNTTDEAVETTTVCVSVQIVSRLLYTNGLHSIVLGKLMMRVWSQ